MPQASSTIPFSSGEEETNETFPPDPGFHASGADEGSHAAGTAEKDNDEIDELDDEDAEEDDDDLDEDEDEDEDDEDDDDR